MAPRIMPTAKGLMRFPYFNMFIVDMKAWQLYVGQSVFVVFVGLFFYLLMVFLRATGISSLPGVSKSVGIIKNLAAGEVDSNYAMSLTS